MEGVIDLKNQRGFKLERILKGERNYPNALKIREVWGDFKGHDESVSDVAVQAGAIMKALEVGID